MGSGLFVVALVVLPLVGVKLLSPIVCRLYCNVDVFQQICQRVCNRFELVLFLLNERFLELIPFKQTI